MKSKKKTKRPAHRPLKLTRALLKHLVEMITATGCTLTDAATAAGVHRATLHRWIAAGDDQAKGIFRDLRDGVREAEAKAKLLDLGTVAKAAGAGDWKAAKWRLEVKHPKEYAPRVLVHVREELGDAVKRLEEVFANVDGKLTPEQALEHALAAVAGEGSAEQAASEEDGAGDPAGDQLGAAQAVAAAD